MHHILGNKILEYDVDDRGVIIDEREYDAATYFIGGCLGNGSSAGWFYLRSDGGLGHSDAGLGCRLVYLP